MAEKELIQLLRRNNELLTLIAKTTLAPVLDHELADPRQRELYVLTGRKTTTELAKKLKMSATTISQLWRRWEQIGLLIKDGQRYRRALD